MKNMQISQTLRDLNYKLAGHRQTHKFTLEEKNELQDFWNEIAGKISPLNWGCGSCVNQALKTLFNYITFHEPKNTIQVAITLESMEREDLLELARIKGIKVHPAIGKDKLLNKLK
jgi:hypothetical protein